MKCPKRFYKSLTVDELFQLGLCATQVKDMQDESDLFEYRTQPVREPYIVGRN